MNLLDVLFQRQAVAGGDALHGLVEFLITDAYAGVVTHIQLKPLRDKALEYLLPENFLWWCLCARALDLHIDGFHAALNFTFKDNILVHHCYHSIENFNLGRSADRKGCQEKRHQAFIA